MYLSYLYIDLGKNPDRLRPGRSWLRNIYRVHQRLCMAFPKGSSKEKDPYFLHPFDPENLDQNHVHVARSEDTGFLYRIDPLPSSSSEPRKAVVVVQSSIIPDWEYAFKNYMHLLCSPPLVRSYNPEFSTGQRFRFKLVANPTKKVGTILKSERMEIPVETLKVRPGRNGKRVPVRADQLADWLLERAAKNGFRIHEDSLEITPGYVNFSKGLPEHQRSYRLRSVTYRGILEVTDPNLFRKAITAGIGPGKGFGFGLLSVYPISRKTQGEVRSDEAVRFAHLA
ncbi:MAG: type I-E CRISPR-associated protein Cas6/Cse3/CasE [bacterium]